MRRVRLGGFGCVVAIALAGCTGQGDEGAPEATSSEQSTEAESSLAPLAIETPPAWTSESLGLGDVDDAQLLDGRAVLNGSVPDRDGSEGVLVIADADAGRELWRLDDFAPIPGGPDLLLYLAADVLAGAPGSEVVYVEGVLASTVPSGQSEVVALSLTDGSLRWRAPVTGSPSFVGAMPEHVAVRLDGLASPTPGRSASSALVLDAGTGALSWESAGFAAEVLAGDALLGSWPTDPPSADPAADEVPGVLELADGAEALAGERGDGDRPSTHR